MNLYHFRAPQYHYKHKSSDWYWVVGIVAISAAVTAIIFNNILFAILIVLAAFSLTVHAAKKPEEHDVEISDAGITIGKYHFSYSTLKSFWIEHNAQPRMLIQTSRTFMSHIIVPVDQLSEEEKAELREFLKTKLPEVEQTEPLFELLMEYLGF